MILKHPHEHYVSGQSAPAFKSSDLAFQINGLGVFRFRNTSGNEAPKLLILLGANVGLRKRFSARPRLVQHCLGGSLALTRGRSASVQGQQVLLYLNAEVQT